MSETDGGDNGSVLVEGLWTGSPLARYVAERIDRADIFLSAADIEPLTIDELGELATEDIDLRRTPLGYAPGVGSCELRDEIASLYRSIGPSQVVSFSGAQEALFALCASTVLPGDHVVVIVPTHPPLYALPRALGADVTTVELQRSDWTIPREQLMSVCRPNTRLVIAAAPNNPTGADIDDSLIHEITLRAEKDGQFVVLDEAFRLLEHEDRWAPALADVSSRGVSIGVLSKAFGLAGLRVGWVATQDDELLKRLARVKDFLSVTQSPIVELLAAVALRAREGILARNRELVLQNRCAFRHVVEECAAITNYVEPTAGTVGFPGLADGEDARTLADNLFQQARVLLVPGDVFGPQWRSHFRMGFGRRTFPQGLDRLAETMRKGRKSRINE
jgi:aspartate/methionine/tyrosine aminotransferase